MYQYRSDTIPYSQLSTKLTLRGDKKWLQRDDARYCYLVLLHIYVATRLTFSNICTIFYLLTRDLYLWTPTFLVSQFHDVDWQ